MIQRCTDPTHRQAKDYSKRGITVCDRWLHSFVNFLADMGERPARLVLDRIDNNGSYEPSNCRWATWGQSNDNRRRKGPQKLNASDVLAIRADPRTYSVIGAAFNISAGHVCRIKSRKQWASI